MCDLLRQDGPHPGCRGRRSVRFGSGGGCDSSSSLSQHRLYWSGISPHPQKVRAPQARSRTHQPGLSTRLRPCRDGPNRRRDRTYRRTARPARAWTALCSRHRALRVRPNRDPGPRAGCHRPGRIRGGGSCPSERKRRRSHRPSPQRYAISPRRGRARTWPAGGSTALNQFDPTRQPCSRHEAAMVARLDVICREEGQQ